MSNNLHQMLLSWGGFCAKLSGIETEAPKNDMITVDLKTQDTQLNPKTESNA